jgi:type I restriction enzyme S subunit
MSKVGKALYSKPSVLIPRKGTLTNIMFVNHPFWCVDTMFYSIFKNEVNGYFAYFILKQLDFEALNQGSAVPSMTTAFLNDIDVVLPNPNILNDFTSALRKIIKHKENLENENQKLTELKALLLSKLATVEN